MSSVSRGTSAIHKAVIPAAGLGTRCLPLTKAVPKELLPVFDRPAIEVIADEARLSGVDTLVLVTGWGKSAIENHFDRFSALEEKVGSQPELVSAITRQTEHLSVLAVRQGAPKGLGHAVGCARPAVGDAPFAVMLPDDILFGDHPALAALVAVYEQHARGVLLLAEVPKEQTRKYGIASVDPLSDGTYVVRGLVEKPRPEEAPSNLAVVGRYVFPPSLFAHIDATAAGALGEIQLTDAMRSLMAEEGLRAVKLSARWLDTGNPLGLLMAGIEVACARDPRAKEALAAVLARQTR